MVGWIQQPAGLGQSAAAVASTSSSHSQPHSAQGELQRAADTNNTTLDTQNGSLSTSLTRTFTPASQNSAPQLPAKDHQQPGKQRSASMAVSQEQQSASSALHGGSDSIRHPTNGQQQPRQTHHQHSASGSGSPSSYHDALPSSGPSYRTPLPALDTSGRPIQPQQQRVMPSQSPSSFPAASSTAQQGQQQRTGGSNHIVSPIPQRRHLPSLPEPGEPARLPSSSDHQARPSSFFGALSDTASTRGSTSTSQQQQQKQQTPQLRVLETERPRISSFFGGLDDHGAGLGTRSAAGGAEYVDSPISADEQPSRRYTPSPNSANGSQQTVNAALRSAGPSSRRTHLPSIPSQSSTASTSLANPNAGPSQQAMYRSASQPPDARYGPASSTSQYSNPAQRSSFYGMEGHHFPTSSSIPSTSNEAQSRSRSEGRYSPGSSRTASQSLPRSETGHSQYSTNQLQQERRRVSSWTTRSNPSSVYGLNALSQNLGGSTGGGGGDTGSVNGIPPVPVLSQAHLRPGDRASLLSHQKTLEAYRANVKKTNDPDITYEFATFMLGIAKEMAQLEHQQQQQQHGRSASTQVSEENLLASLHDHSASPSPDPSMSFHSRSSGSSGDLHSSNSNSNGGGGGGLASGYSAALSSAAAGKRRTTSQSPNPSSLHLSVHTNNTGGTASPPRLSSPSSSPADRKALVNEAIALLKRNADRGHYQSQFFLADCYSQGIGTGRRGSNSGLKDFGIDKNAGQNAQQNGDGTGSNNASPTSTSKPDYDKALMLYTSAAKHGHVPSYFRAGQCFENGWGCRKDSAKAVQFYRKAASQSYAAAMYRLGIAELNGELGLKDRQKEGFKWLKRVAELAETSGDEATDAALIQQQQAQQNGNADQYALEDPILLDPSNPLAEPSARACAVQALHELALLHERGIHNVVFVDNEYAAELLARASELGYAPSAYKLGECYEYGKMGCPQDSALSIHYYNIAAQQNHREACFALTAWYLVGSPGVLPQSDTEAYLWAKKAAEQGLAKAEYAVGYFTEVGIGTVRDEREAISWFRRAADHGDKRAVTRLRTLGGVAMYPSPPNSPAKGKGSVDEPVGGGSRMSVMGLGGKKNSTASNHSKRRATMSGISSTGSANGKKTDGDCVIM